MNQIINLCLIAEHFHPNLSGASERFRRYLPGLHKRGINTQVFTIWKEGLDKQEKIDGATIYRLTLPPSKIHPSAELTKQTLQFFKQSGQWPDVVHILSHTVQGVPYLWPMRLRGIPCVNSITMYPVNNSSGVLEKFLYFQHQWRRYNVFNKIITSSQLIKDSIKGFGIPEHRITVIPNGVDLSRFQPLKDGPEKTRLRQIIGLGEFEKIVLYVGFISQRKGIDLLLEAWPEISNFQPQAKLVLIGPEDREGQYNTLFEPMLNKLNRATYLGPQENVEFFMQIADVFVLPSRLEGMPNVVLEAMACGIPCVLTPFQGLPESFGKPGVDYILTSFDPLEIADRINTLLSNSDRCEAIGNAGLERVQRMFNNENSLDEHAWLYHQLVRQKVSKKVSK